MKAKISALMDGELEQHEADGALAALGGEGEARETWRRSLLVAAGMLPPESFRLLRLWARWGRLPGVAPLQLPPAP